MCQVLSKPWRAAPLYRQERFFVGEASSLDYRGKMPLPQKRPNLLESKKPVAIFFFFLLNT
jgi:hypothetical protein